MAHSWEIHAATREAAPGVAMGEMGHHILADPLTGETERRLAARAVRRLAPAGWTEMALEALGLDEPDTGPPPPPPIDHGTRRGYDQHRRRGEDACEPCREARRAYDHERWRAQGWTPKRPVPCGTWGGLRRHQRHGEQPCDECLEVRRAWWRKYRRSQPSRPRPQARCGTRAGLQRHRARGEPPCVGCMEADRAYQRDRYLRRKAARQEVSA